VRVNLKSGSGVIVASLQGNVARSDGSVLKQVTEKIVTRWNVEVEIHERNFQCRFVQNFKGYFYYRYRPCIRVNLEIEGAENKLLATNTRVVIDSPWETLLGLSFMVMGRD